MLYLWNSFEDPLHTLVGQLDRYPKLTSLKYLKQAQLQIIVWKEELFLACGYEPPNFWRNTSKVG